MDNPTIYVAGSFIMGLTIQVPRVPAIGETLIGKNFDLGPGGKGVNQSIAASRAGGNVQVSVCIGDDTFGKLAFDLLEKEGIYSHSVRHLSDAYTGCGFVTLLETGENSIIIDPGANSKLTSTMISEDEEVIRTSAVVMAQLEIPDGPVEAALRLAKKHTCKTILNPAPARILTPKALKNVDILTPNETEAKILLGYPPDSKRSIEELASGLLDLGIQTIVVTRGKDGVLIADQQGFSSIPAPQISVVDPTGAGDCFNGNLAYGLSEGWSIEKAVKRAVYAGAYCVGYLGVIKGLPTKSELDQYISKFKMS